MKHTQICDEFGLFNFKFLLLFILKYFLSDLFKETILLNLLASTLKEIFLQLDWGAARYCYT